MMSKTRSAFLSLYAALTPALASAKCGNVDYSWGADALASAHDYAVTMMLYIVYLCYAVAGIVVIVSALQIYIKMNTGEEGVKKNTKREWDKYTFGCYGCWVMGDDGNLDYVPEEEYTEELWNEQKKNGERNRASFSMHK